MLTSPLRRSTADLYPTFALQFDCLDFNDVSLVVVGGECMDRMEHGISEATDIPDVLRS